MTLNTMHAYRFGMNFEETIVGKLTEAYSCYRSTYGMLYCALCLIYTYTYFISRRRLHQVWHIYSIIGHLHVPTGMVPYL